MDRLLKLAEQHKIDELELAWMQAAEAEDVDWPDMLTAARLIAGQHDAAVAESLISYLTAELEGSGRLYEALRAAEQACAFLSGSEKLRTEYSLLFGKYYENEKWCRPILDATLRNSSLNLPAALAALRKMEKLLPGTCFRKNPGARIGRVENIIPQEGLEVNIEGTVQCVPLEELWQLHPLPDNDIRALILFDRPQLAEMAESDSVELVRLILLTFEGRTELKRIRRYLQPVVGESKWGSWWKRTQKELDRTPDIGSTSGKNPQFFLRDKPLSRSEELKTKFDRSNDENLPVAAVDIAEELNPESEEDLKLLLHMNRNLLASSGKNAARKPETAVNALAALWKINSKIPDLPAKNTEIPQWIESQDWVRLIKTDLCDSTFFLDIIQYLPTWMPEKWADIFIETLPFLPPRGCEKASAILEQEKGSDALQKAVTAVLKRPDARLGALLWVWNVFRKDLKSQDHSKGLDGMVILRRILSAAASEGRASSEKNSSTLQALDALGQAFSGDGEDAVQTAAEKGEDDEILALINLVERNPALNTRTSKQMARAVRAARPELFRTSTPPWETNVIYTTMKGLAKRQAVYDELVNEKIPAIVKQIGEAAAFGDLSENAEYTAALEERERLSHRAAEIKNELSLSCVIPPDMPGTDYVGIGCRVKTLYHNTGEELILTFLGPWDTDPSNHIYAYNSPLALSFMGAKPDEEVCYEAEDCTRKWKVISIEPATGFLD